jgi:ketosteroid isomerase-like protein
MWSVAFGLFVALASLVVVSPLPAQSGDEAAIRALRVGPGAVYTDDVFFFTGAYDRPIIGKEPPPPPRHGERKNFKMEDKIEKLFISKSGDLAYTYGTATIGWDGQEPFDAAFLRVYRKEGGKWKTAAVFQRPMGTRLGPPNPDRAGQ